ncbi:hypothetical protein GSI_15443 [Ganoderma sinense ZZ0214-1]|uniref:Uncharacterized protein n=1 Tax=Ganoderma sinense ZZ0214-1 TaxID=1077348 RepID=A0A2G8RML9_9APHY|nr:hypothetical protein GSI_15443 [Ganoderma sinense ZZ0214-1]
MEDALSLGRTRSATAANVRGWSAAAPHSHSRARTAGPAPRSGAATGRVVANTDQVYALKQFLERAGPDVTAKDIEAVAAETGLDGKWIRQWIRRQVNSSRNKAKKGKKHTGSSTGETTPSSQVSRGASPDGSFTPILPQPAPGQDLSNTGATMQKFTFVALEGFETGSKSRQRSGQSSTGSTMVATGHSGLISSSSSAAGYDWNKTPLSRGYQTDPLNPQAHLSPIHTTDPGASFMVPFRSEATDHSSPDFRSNVAQWSAYRTAYPRNIREAELLVSSVTTVPSGPGGSYISSRTSATAFPTSKTPSQNVPDCLTAGSAYLYRLFHERLVDTPPTAPPETPHLDGAMYMAGLTRPSGTIEGRGAPQALSSATLPSASMPVFPSVLGYSGYPVAYQMHFSDLIHLSKITQGNTAKVEGPSANTFIPSSTVPKLGDPNEPSGVQHGLDQPTGDMDPSRSQFLRVVVDAASSDMAQEEGETEDEHEAVTPCDMVDSAVSKGKEKEKFADTQVVIVEASEVDGA